MDSMKKTKKIGKSKESKRKPKEINENQLQMKGNQWEINEKQQFSIDFLVFSFFFMESLKKQIFPWKTN